VLRDVNGHCPFRRARRRRADGADAVEVDEARHVDAARQRAGEITGQVTGMVEHLTQQLGTLVEQLRTVGDPEAVEAQLEAVNSEAAEQIAAANARATRAEQVQRRAEAEREEAEAAAAEASDQVEELIQELAGARAAFSEAVEAGERAAEELAQVRADAQEAERAAAAEAELLNARLAEANERLARTERQRDEALARAETAEVIQATPRRSVPAPPNDEPTATPV
jgi:colicin import membrane protein